MAPVLLAEIPYTTFPSLDLGILELRTFGLMVALGVLVGAWVAARYGEEHGIPRDTTYSLAMRMVLAGVIGSRVTWVLTHLDDLDTPWQAFAIWEGGLQFSGGFIAAVIFGYPVFRHWNRITRWNSLDGLAMGLSIGTSTPKVDQDAGSGDLRRRCDRERTRSMGTPSADKGLHLRQEPLHVGGELLDRQRRGQLLVGRGVGAVG